MVLPPPTCGARGAFYPVWGCFELSARKLYTTRNGGCTVKCVTGYLPYRPKLGGRDDQCQCSTRSAVRRIAQRLYRPERHLRRAWIAEAADQTGGGARVGSRADGPPGLCAVWPLRDRGPERPQRQKSQDRADGHRAVASGGAA